MPITRIISGGQTGTDQGALAGALDAASLGWSGTIGGWAPRSFVTEGGVIPQRFAEHMREHESASYEMRTISNVEDSDATFIVYASDLHYRHGYGAGTAMTIRRCIERRKMVFMQNLRQPHEPLRRLFFMDDTTRWRFVAVADGTIPRTLTFILQHGVTTLNVAGPRESHAPGLQARVHVFVRDLLLAQR